MEDSFGLMKFYCPICNTTEIGKLIDLQTANGISQNIICPSCGKLMDIALLSAFSERLSEVANGKISIESMMYIPTKIDKDGQEYDMQPRSKR